MPLSPAALKTRLDNQLNSAMNRFKGNPYVTIHGHTDPVSGKTDPFAVYISLHNYQMPVVDDMSKIDKHALSGLSNMQIVRTVDANVSYISSVEGICIKYSSGYPQTKPTVYLPKSIKPANVHYWADKENRICNHAVYIPEVSTLTNEIENVMTFFANASNDFSSPTPAMSQIQPWVVAKTNEGKLPTIKKEVLLGLVKRVRRGNVAS